MTTETECACADLGRETHDCDPHWRRAVNNGTAWDDAHMINWWVDQIGLRVTLGALRLDGAYPRWERDVDTDQIDMGCTRYCVLGQLYGTFHTGLDALDMDCAKSEHSALGFNRYTNTQWSEVRRNAERANGGARIYFDYPDINEEYGLLDRAWRRAIKARLDAS